MTEKPSNEIAETVGSIMERIRLAAERAGRSPADIRLMAVTKTVPPERVNEAIAAGCDLLGENRVQELLDKYDSYDRSGAEIHFIGHLQTNKVKYIADKVTMIESVDSVKLAQEIDRQCKKLGKSMDVLLEVNIAAEESKSGFLPEEIEQAVIEMTKFSNINVRGLMTIGPVGAEIDETRHCFSKMRKLLVDIGGKKLDNISMNVLSMGMSGDYEEAVEEGSTIVRVGRGLFGARPQVIPADK